MLKIVAILLVLASTAYADGKFQVDPTRVDLAAQAQTGAITVTNHGTEPLRLQISAVTWSDDEHGVMQLAPTKDIVVRPSLIEIAPGSRTTVRVGVTIAARAIEQTYRLFVEELPDRRPKPAGRIDVLTRIGIPVFVAPKVVTDKLQLSVTGNTVTVVNAGTVHVKLMNIRLRDGKSRWQREIAGWYVLPNATREFVVPGAACDAADELIADVTDEDGTTTSARGRCGP